MTPLERQIATVWAAELGTPVEDPDTDFFTTGGNSFQAATVIANLRRRLGVEIPLRYIFNQPTTVSGLAAQIEVLRWQTDTVKLSSQGAHDYEEGEL